MCSLTCFVMSLVLLAIAGAPALAQSGSFGNAVLVTDDELIISEPNTTFRAGAVYVYRKVGDDWREAGQIHAPNRERADGFGTVLAATGNTLFVGQRNGPLHTYERDGQGWRHTGTVSGDGVNGTDPGCGQYGYCGTEFGVPVPLLSPRLRFCPVWSTRSRGATTAPGSRGRAYGQPTAGRATALARHSFSRRVGP